ncbi:MAG: hypothetical protein ACJAYU_001308 [Bradymonadia bacterium]|jgi:hypothetical protein
MSPRRAACFDRQVARDNSHTPPNRAFRPCILAVYEDYDPKLALTSSCREIRSTLNTPVNMTLRITSSLLLTLSLAACGSEAEPLADTGEDVGTDPTTDTSTDPSTDEGSTTLDCPPGPMPPLGESCSEGGAVCGYGYDPPECGGITIECVAGEWLERERTDPGNDCVSPGSVACADVQNQYEQHVLDNQNCLNTDECVVIEGADTCDCSPAIFNGSGDAINYEAAGVARQLADVYWECVDSGEIEIVSAVCDAGPGQAACVDGQCRVTGADCMGIDAGTPDAGMPDAG